MSLQTTSDVKVKKEAPVEVDSSPPDSPESVSGRSENSKELLVRGKVGQKLEGGVALGQRGEGETFNDVKKKQKNSMARMAP